MDQSQGKCIKHQHSKKHSSLQLFAPCDAANVIYKVFPDCLFLLVPSSLGRCRSRDDKGDK